MIKSIRHQKAATVLRDDLIEYYIKLKEQLKIKYSLIDSLYTGEMSKINLIKTGAFQEAEDIFIDDGEIFSKIDSADFEITSLIDNICRIRGIDKIKFLKLFQTESHPIITEAYEIERNTSNKLEKLVEEKEKFISNFGKEMDEVKKTIKTLADISRIKKQLN